MIPRSRRGQAIERTIEVAAGIALAACLAGLALGQNSPALCVHGHPAPRRPDVTFGGKPPLHGFQRDHYVPLGLGGPDIASNVHYQRCDETGPFGRCEAGPAARKDADEHEAEEEVCSGRWEPDYARKWLADRWPLDVSHGYLFQPK